jgi:hypothetical protein
MSHQIRITISIPEGGTVEIEAPEDTGSETSSVDKDQVERYFEYQTDNGKKLYRAMAAQEMQSSPWSFDEIAERLGNSHSEALALNRNAARAVKLWKRDTGTEPPFKPIAQGNVPGRKRKTFRLPEGVAETIVSLD